MTEYIFFMRGGDARKLDLSESEMGAHMEDWKQYMQSLGASGILHGGAPLGEEGFTISGTGKAESEGTQGGDISRLLLLRARPGHSQRYLQSPRSGTLGT